MKKIAKVISVLLIVLIGTCFLVACGENAPTVYGTAQYRAEMRRQINKEREYPEIEVWSTMGEMCLSREDRREEASILDIKGCKGPLQYVVEHEKEENGIVVSKWLYYYCILGIDSARKDGYNDKLLMLDSNRFLEQAIEDADCIEKVCVALGLYAFKQGAYQGRRVYELTNTEQDTDILAEIVKEWKDENPLLYEYETDGSLYVASLVRYGAISLESIEMTVGTLDVKINGQVKTLPVVGYYETDADKIMSTGIDPNPQSEAYQKVYAQLQRPVFYSVTGDIFK